ncbi:MAG: hypothetical protein R6U51_07165 [Anaerolineales bacterium]
MITIGATGHRFLAEEDKIISSVDQALDKIQQTFEGSSLNVVSSLAEGADRLIVQRTLERKNISLTALLPMPQQEYIKDFDSIPSRKEFQRLVDQAQEIITLPTPTTREGAYHAAGQHLLNLADVLISIWDGQRPQGKGGTGEITIHARQQGLPLAWIHAGNRMPGTEQPTTLGEEQGLVTFENFTT